MLVQIDFYMTTGKWKYGGRVEIPSQPYEDGVLKDIVKHQNIIVDGWWEHKAYYLVVSDLPESLEDPNYRCSYSRLYTPDHIYQVMTDGYTKKVGGGKG